MRTPARHVVLGLLLFAPAVAFAGSVARSEPVAVPAVEAVESRVDPAATAAESKLAWPSALVLPPGAPSDSDLRELVGSGGPVS